MPKKELNEKPTATEKPAVKDAPAKKAAPAKKTAPAKKAAPTKKAAPVKKAAPAAKKPAAKKTTVVIQSPLGGEITPEDVLAKVGSVDEVYIRVDVNKAYWVKGEETGEVDLW